MISNDMQINKEFIKIIRSKNTLRYNHNYCNNILRLISNIHSIKLNKSFITSKLLSGCSKASTNEHLSIQCYL